MESKVRDRRAASRRQRATLTAAAVIGRLAQVQDDRAQAGRLVDRAQAIVRASPPGLWDAKLDARTEVGVALAKLGNQKEARASFDEALSLLERGPADRHPAASGRRLVRALEDAGETDRAARASRAMATRFPPDGQACAISAVLLLALALAGQGSRAATRVSEKA